MSRFVAFLRGINVGGRVVTKDTLQKVFIELGYRNVSTYKQSGNVIFETSETNIEENVGKIQKALYAALNFEVPVFLRTVAQLKTIVKVDPFRKQKSEGSSFLVTFLNTFTQFSQPFPIIIPKSTAQIIAATGTEVFSVTHGGGEGALPNPFVEKQFKLKATTRNFNIIKEIVEKFG
jgi:uncharacterized protein (DUF1697 family)